MQRWLKISLVLVIAMLALTVLLWLGAALYVNTHKPQLLKEITTQLNGNINGKLNIEEMEPRLIIGFPLISVALKNVTLRDSLWQTHKQELVFAKSMFISVNFFSIIRGRHWISEVKVKDGGIYLFVDSAGNSNLNLFRKTSDLHTNEKSRITNLSFEHMQFVFENRSHLKYYELDINKLAFAFNYSDTGWVAATNIDVLIKNLSFNTGHGSYLKNKKITATTSITYDQSRSVLDIPPQDMAIDADHVKVGATFRLGPVPQDFSVNIHSGAIACKNAIAMLPYQSAARLRMLDFTKPVDLSVWLNGQLRYGDTPYVKVMGRVNDNDWHIRGTHIRQCSFECTYTNQSGTSAFHNDQHSLITVRQLRGAWLGMAFRADTLMVADLTRPVLAGRFYSDFELNKLNSVAGKIFHFSKGAVAISINYRGGINEDDTTASFITGTAAVRDADFTYVPDSLSFTGSNATVRFAGNDVYLEDVKLQTGANRLAVNGYLKNFTSLYYTHPEKILLDCKITSPEINLDEFIGLLHKKKITAPARGKDRDTTISRIAHQLTRMLDMGTFRINIHTDKLSYGNFTTNAVNANISLEEDAIVLRKTIINHAGGTLTLDAALRRRRDANDLTLDVDIERANVSELFRSFQNFGQKKLTSENIGGIINARAGITARITDNAEIVAGSVNGVVTYHLRSATLTNFEPLQRVGKFVFRHRDLSHVHFRELTNKLEIKGDKIFIDPMHIESNVITINVAGTYGLTKGTDIDIDIPLRNPKKDELIENDSLRAERSMKGIVVHLKATDDEDGNIVLKWVMRNKKERPAGKKHKKIWWKRTQQE